HRISATVASVAFVALAALAAAALLANHNRILESRRLAEKQAHEERLQAEQQQNLLDRVLLSAMSGDFGGAEKSADEAELLHASAGQVRMLRGLVDYYRGDMDTASRNLEQAVKLIPAGQPGAVAARSLLAMAYAKSLHGTDWEKLYREIVTLSPIS